MFKLHVSSITDAPNNNVLVVLKALQAISTNGPQGSKAGPTPSNSTYPGFNVIGSLTVQLSAADAATFPRGSEFTLAAIG